MSYKIKYLQIVIKYNILVNLSRYFLPLTTQNIRVRYKCAVHSYATDAEGTT